MTIWGLSPFAAAFTVTIFLGAFLLFAVQPMVGKLLLPRVGGAPALWITCMVFYQAALLAGYGLAHGLARLPAARWQVAIYLVLAAGALVLMPVAVPGTAPPVEGSPVPWLLGTLAGAVGLPFLVVATAAPLLQQWLAGTSDPRARDPYFLYAASNAGSLAALLAYPLAIEPWIGLQRQGIAWAAGFATFTALAATCGVARLAAPGVARPVAGGVSPRPSRGRYATWVVLAFVPSSLMLGATQHITTDVAAVPLLWILPLAIYLLTFILAFARRQVIRPRFCSGLVVLAGIPALGVATGWHGFPVAVILALHLSLLFVAAFMCHGRLAESRPDPRFLTGFYLAVAAGGALGGVFNALLAPVLFDRVIEYPLVIVLAVLLRDRGGLSAWRPPVGRWANPAVDLLAVGLAAAGVRWSGAARYADIVETDRSFFGVHAVGVDEEAGWTAYYHGTTLHGIQYAAHPREALSYYHDGTGLGRLYRTLDGDPRLDRVGVVGLGTGTLGARARPGQQYTFFEIDPAVVRIAGDQRYFTYLRDMPQPPRIVIGDGRLSLGREPDGSFGLIVLDAFTSDAIPVHLLTAEAVELYFGKLEAAGLLAVNVTNRHVRLGPLVAGLAASLGLAAAEWTGTPEPVDPAETGRFQARWLVMARDTDALAGLLADGWSLLPSDRGDPVWTDDYSNLLGVLRWWR